MLLTLLLLGHPRGSRAKRAASGKNMKETSHKFLIEIVILQPGESWRGSEGETKRRECLRLWQAGTEGRDLEGPLPQVPVIAGTLVLVQELWIPSYHNYSISIIERLME